MCNIFIFSTNLCERAKNKTNYNDFNFLISIMYKSPWSQAKNAEIKIV